MMVMGHRWCFPSFLDDSWNLSCCKHYLYQNQVRNSKLLGAKVSLCLQIANDFLKIMSPKA